MSNNLSKYHAWLLAHQLAQPISSRPETPADLQVKTLWIPVWSGNRTATIDLNHEIYPLMGGFMEADWFVQGYEFLVGYNGNCQTPYAIVEIPLQWTDATVDELARRVAKRLDKPADYPYYRALKADSRMHVIVEEIERMKAE
jgi:hypothetical protein